MSALARLFHHLPPPRRSYSSFGGGRYFNSSKHTKSPVVTAKSKSDTPNSAPKDSSTKASSATKSAKSKNTTPPTTNAKPASDATSSESRHEAAAQQLRNTGAASSSSSLRSYPPNPYHNYLSPHPIVNPKDFKIHQFFSLHRPLLLISNPPSIFTSPPTDAPLLRLSLLGRESDSNAVDVAAADKLPPSPFTSLNLDGTYGSAAMGVGVDEDAEAARQLHHAMTMNRVGSLASWEETLKALGLDVSKDAERVQLREQWDREWEEVMMDSVKRKRRKKMKKHKLQKRRRATRSQRMRIGR